MAEHTAGPWDGIGVIPQHYIVWRSNYNDATDTRIIATGIEREADAHLIAAAPELYEALEYWLEHQGDECPDGFRSMDEHCCWEMRAMRQARAALAKARGEPE